MVHMYDPVMTPSDLAFWGQTGSNGSAGEPCLDFNKKPANILVIFYMIPVNYG